MILKLIFYRFNFYVTYINRYHNEYLIPQKYKNHVFNAKLFPQDIYKHGKRFNSLVVENEGPCVDSDSGPFSSNSVRHQSPYFQPEQFSQATETMNNSPNSKRKLTRGPSNSTVTDLPLEDTQSFQLQTKTSPKPSPEDLDISQYLKTALHRGSMAEPPPEGFKDLIDDFDEDDDSCPWKINSITRQVDSIDVGEIESDDPVCDIIRRKRIPLYAEHESASSSHDPSDAVRYTNRTKEVYYSGSSKIIYQNDQGEVRIRYDKKRKLYKHFKKFHLVQSLDELDEDNIVELLESDMFVADDEEYDSVSAESVSLFSECSSDDEQVTHELPLMEQCFSVENLLSDIVEIVNDNKIEKESSLETETSSSPLTIARNYDFELQKTVVVSEASYDNPEVARLLKKSFECSEKSKPELLEGKQFSSNCTILLQSQENGSQIPSKRPLTYSSDVTCIYGANNIVGEVSPVQDMVFSSNSSFPPQHTVTPPLKIDISPVKYYPVPPTPDKTVFITYSNTPAKVTPSQESKKVSPDLKGSEVVQRLYFPEYSDELTDCYGELVPYLASSSKQAAEPPFSNNDIPPSSVSPLDSGISSPFKNVVYSSIDQDDLHNQTSPSSFPDARRFETLSGSSSEGIERDIYMLPNSRNLESLSEVETDDNLAAYLNDSIYKRRRRSKSTESIGEIQVYVDERDNVSDSLAETSRSGGILQSMQGDSRRRKNKMKKKRSMSSGKMSSSVQKVSGMLHKLSQSRMDLPQAILDESLANEEIACLSKKKYSAKLPMLCSVSEDLSLDEDNFTPEISDDSEKLSKDRRKALMKHSESEYSLGEICYLSPSDADIELNNVGDMIFGRYSPSHNEHFPVLKAISDPVLSRKVDMPEFLSKSVDEEDNEEDTEEIICSHSSHTISEDFSETFGVADPFHLFSSECSATTSGKPGKTMRILEDSLLSDEGGISLSSLSLKSTDSNDLCDYAKDTSACLVKNDVIPVCVYLDDGQVAGDLVLNEIDIPHSEYIAEEVVGQDTRHILEVHGLQMWCEDVNSETESHIPDIDCDLFYNARNRIEHPPTKISEDSDKISAKLEKEQMSRKLKKKKRKKKKRKSLSPDASSSSESCSTSHSEFELHQSEANKKFAPKYLTQSLTPDYLFDGIIDNENKNDGNPSSPYPPCDLNIRHSHAFIKLISLPESEETDSPDSEQYEAKLRSRNNTPASFHLWSSGQHNPKPVETIFESIEPEIIPPSELQITDAIGFGYVEFGNENIYSTSTQELPLETQCPILVLTADVDEYSYDHDALAEYEDNILVEGKVAEDMIFYDSDEPQVDFIVLHQIEDEVLNKRSDTLCPVANVPNFADNVNENITFQPSPLATVDGLESIVKESSLSASLRRIRGNDSEIPQLGSNVILATFIPSDREGNSSIDGEGNVDKEKTFPSVNNPQSSSKESLDTDLPVDPSHNLVTNSLSETENMFNDELYSSPDDRKVGVFEDNVVHLKGEITEDQKSNIDEERAPSHNFSPTLYHPLRSTEEKVAEYSLGNEQRIYTSEGVQLPISTISPVLSKPDLADSYFSDTEGEGDVDKEIITAASAHKISHSPNDPKSENISSDEKYSSPHHRKVEVLKDNNILLEGEIAEDMIFDDIHQPQYDHVIEYQVETELIGGDTQLPFITACPIGTSSARRHHVNNEKSNVNYERVSSLSLSPTLNSPQTSTAEVFTEYSQVNEQKIFTNEGVQLPISTISPFLSTPDLVDSSLAETDSKLVEGKERDDDIEKTSAASLHKISPSTKDPKSSSEESICKDYPIYLPSDLVESSLSEFESKLVGEREDDVGKEMTSAGSSHKTSPSKNDSQSISEERLCKDLPINSSSDPVMSSLSETENINDVLFDGEVAEDMIFDDFHQPQYDHVIEYKVETELIGEDIRLPIEATSLVGTSQTQMHHVDNETYNVDKEKAPSHKFSPSLHHPQTSTEETVAEYSLGDEQKIFTNEIVQLPISTISPVLSTPDLVDSSLSESNLKLVGESEDDVGKERTSAASLHKISPSTKNRKSISKESLSKNSPINSSSGPVISSFSESDIKLVGEREDKVDKELNSAGSSHEMPPSTNDSDSISEESLCKDLPINSSSDPVISSLSETINLFSDEKYSSPYNKKVEVFDDNDVLFDGEISEDMIFDDFHQPQYDQFIEYQVETELIGKDKMLPIEITSLVGTSPTQRNPVNNVDKEIASSHKLSPSLNHPQTSSEKTVAEYSLGDKEVQLPICTISPTLSTPDIVISSLSESDIKLVGESEDVVDKERTSAASLQKMSPTNDPKSSYEESLCNDSPINSLSDPVMSSLSETESKLVGEKEDDVDKEITSSGSSHKMPPSTNDPKSSYEESLCKDLPINSSSDPVISSFSETENIFSDEKYSSPYSRKVEVFDDNDVLLDGEVAEDMIFDEFHQPQYAQVIEYQVETEIIGKDKMLPIETTSLVGTSPTQRNPVNNVDKEIASSHKLSPSLNHPQTSSEKTVAEYSLGDEGVQLPICTISPTLSTPDIVDSSLSESDIKLVGESEDVVDKERTSAASLQKMSPTNDPKSSYEESLCNDSPINSLSDPVMSSLSETESKLVGEKEDDVDKEITSSGSSHKMPPSTNDPKSSYEESLCKDLPINSSSDPVISSFSETENIFSNEKYSSPYSRKVEVFDDNDVLLDGEVAEDMIFDEFHQPQYAQVIEYQVETEIIGKDKMLPIETTSLVGTSPTQRNPVNNVDKEIASSHKLSPSLNHPQTSSAKTVAEYSLGDEGVQLPICTISPTLSTPDIVDSSLSESESKLLGESEDVVDKERTSAASLQKMSPTNDPKSSYEESHCNDSPINSLSDPVMSSLSETESKLVGEKEDDVDKEITSSGSSHKMPPSTNDPKSSYEESLCKDLPINSSSDPVISSFSETENIFSDEKYSSPYSRKVEVFDDNDVLLDGEVAEDMIFDEFHQPQYAQVIEYQVETEIIGEDKMLPIETTSLVGTSPTQRNPVNNVDKEIASSHKLSPSLNHPQKSSEKTVAEYTLGDEGVQLPICTISPTLSTPDIVDSSLSESEIKLVGESEDVVDKERTSAASLQKMSPTNDPKSSYEESLCKDSPINSSYDPVISSLSDTESKVVGEKEDDVDKKINSSGSSHKMPPSTNDPKSSYEESLCKDLPINSSSDPVISSFSETENIFSDEKYSSPYSRKVEVFEDNDVLLDGEVAEDMIFDEFHQPQYAQVIEYQVETEIIGEDKMLPIETTSLVGTSPTQRNPVNNVYKEIASSHKLSPSLNHPQTSSEKTVAEYSLGDEGVQLPICTISPTLSTPDIVDSSLSESEIKLVGESEDVVDKERTSAASLQKMSPTNDPKSSYEESLCKDSPINSSYDPVISSLSDTESKLVWEKEDDVDKEITSSGSSHKMPPSTNDPKSSYEESLCKDLPINSSSDPVISSFSETENIFSDEKYSSPYSRKVEVFDDNDVLLDGEVAEDMIFDEFHQPQYAQVIEYQVETEIIGEDKMLPIETTSLVGTSPTQRNPVNNVDKEIASSHKLSPSLNHPQTSSEKTVAEYSLGDEGVQLPICTISPTLSTPDIVDSSLSESESKLLGESEDVVDKERTSAASLQKMSPTNDPKSSYEESLCKDSPINSSYDPVISSLSDTESKVVGEKEDYVDKKINSSGSSHKMPPSTNDPKSSYEESLCKDLPINSSSDPVISSFSETENIFSDEKYSSPYSRKVEVFDDNDVLLDGEVAEDMIFDEFHQPQYAQVIKYQVETEIIGKDKMLPIETTSLVGTSPTQRNPVNNVDKETASSHKLSPSLNHPQTSSEKTVAEYSLGDEGVQLPICTISPTLSTPDIVDSSLSESESKLLGESEDVVDKERTSAASLQKMYPTNDPKSSYEESLCKDLPINSSSDPVISSLSETESKLVGEKEDDVDKEITSSGSSHKMPPSTNDPKSSYEESLCKDLPINSSSEPVISSFSETENIFSDEKYSSPYSRKVEVFDNNYVLLDGEIAEDMIFDEFHQPQYYQVIEYQVEKEIIGEDTMLPIETTSLVRTSPTQRNPVNNVDKEIASSHKFSPSLYHPRTSTDETVAEYTLGDKQKIFTNEGVQLPISTISPVLSIPDLVDGSLSESDIKLVGESEDNVGKERTSAASLHKISPSTKNPKSISEKSLCKNSPINSSSDLVDSSFSDSESKLVGEEITSTGSSHKMSPSTNDSQSMSEENLCKDLPINLSSDPVIRSLSETKNKLSDEKYISPYIRKVEVFVDNDVFLDGEIAEDMIFDDFHQPEYDHVIEYQVEKEIIGEDTMLPIETKSLVGTSPTQRHHVDNGTSNVDKERASSHNLSLSHYHPLTSTEETVAECSLGDEQNIYTSEGVQLPNSTISPVLSTLSLALPIESSLDIDRSSLSEKEIIGDDIMLPVAADFHAITYPTQRQPVEDGLLHGLSPSLIHPQSSFSKDFDKDSQGTEVNIFGNEHYDLPFCRKFEFLDDIGVCVDGEIAEDLIFDDLGEPQHDIIATYEVELEVIDVTKLIDTALLVVSMPGSKSILSTAGIYHVDAQTNNADEDKSLSGSHHRLSTTLSDQQFYPFNRHFKFIDESGVFVEGGFAEDMIFDDFDLPQYDHLIEYHVEKEFIVDERLPSDTALLIERLPDAEGLFSPTKLQHLGDNNSDSSKERASSQSSYDESLGTVSPVDSSSELVECSFSEIKNDRLGVEEGEGDKERSNLGSLHRRYPLLEPPQLRCESVDNSPHDIEQIFSNEHNPPLVNRKFEFIDDYGVRVDGEMAEDLIFDDFDEPQYIQIIVHEVEIEVIRNTPSSIISSTLTVDDGVECKLFSPITPDCDADSAISLVDSTCQTTGPLLSPKYTQCSVERSDTPTSLSPPILVESATQCELALSEKSSKHTPSVSTQASITQQPHSFSAPCTVETEDHSVQFDTEKLVSSHDTLCSSISSTSVSSQTNDMLIQTQEQHDTCPEMSSTYSQSSQETDSRQTQSDFGTLYCSRDTNDTASQVEPLCRHVYSQSEVDTSLLLLNDSYYAHNKSSTETQTEPESAVDIYHNQSSTETQTEFESDVDIWTPNLICVDMEESELEDVIVEAEGQDTVQTWNRTLESMDRSTQWYNEEVFFDASEPSIPSYLAQVSFDLAEIIRYS